MSLATQLQWKEEGPGDALILLAHTNGNELEQRKELTLRSSNVKNSKLVTLTLERGRGRRGSQLPMGFTLKKRERGGAEFVVAPIKFWMPEATYIKEQQYNARQLKRHQILTSFA